MWVFYVCSNTKQDRDTCEVKNVGEESDDEASDLSGVFSLTPKVKKDLIFSEFQEMLRTLFF